MSKKKGIITLVCVIAFLLAGTWTAVFGLDSAKTGSAANIKQGLDLAGGRKHHLSGGGRRSTQLGGYGRYHI